MLPFRARCLRMTDPVIRQLTPQDAAEWRDFRLEMLRLAPDAFSTRLVDWQDRSLADFAARLELARAFVAEPRGRQGPSRCGKPCRTILARH